MLNVESRSFPFSCDEVGRFAEQPAPTTLRRTEFGNFAEHNADNLR
jgi:hypothetical protein